MKAPGGFQIIKALDHVAVNANSPRLAIRRRMSTAGSTQSAYACGHTPRARLRRLWQQGVATVIAAGSEVSGAQSRPIDANGHFSAARQPRRGDRSFPSGEYRMRRVVLSREPTAAAKRTGRSG
jgi:hypothetical protein